MPPPPSGPPASGPRILSTTGSLLLSPLPWTLGAIADAGYDGVELMIGPSAESRDPERVVALADAAGLDVPVVHGPYLLLTRGVLGWDYAEKTRQSLRVAAAVGAHTLVAHPPMRWERRSRRWVADEAQTAAAEAGVRFTMENLFPVGGRAFASAITPEQLAEHPYVTFDTSHFAVAGVDLFTAWSALHDRVVHLHVSDNHGNGRDSHAPIGTGVLPLAPFLRHVGASGWTGTITLELDCRAYLESRDSLVRFLAVEREKATTLLAGGTIAAEPARAADAVGSDRDGGHGTGDDGGLAASGAASGTASATLARLAPRAASGGDAAQG